jgi:hypothetical protein
MVLATFSCVKRDNPQRFDHLDLILKIMGSYGSYDPVESLRMTRMMQKIIHLFP